MTLRSLLPINFGLRFGDWIVFTVKILDPPAEEEDEVVSNATGFGFTLANDDPPDEVQPNLDPLEE